MHRRRLGQAVPLAPVDQAFHRLIQCVDLLAAPGNVVGGAIADAVAVEHRDVGDGAGPQVPAVIQVQEIGGQPGHAANGERHRDDPLIEHELAELAREGAEYARVRDVLRGGWGAAVGAGHHPGLPRQVARVLDVVEVEVHHRRVAGGQDAPHGRRYRQLPLGRHRGERPAVQLRPRVGEQELVGAPADRQHLHRLDVEPADGLGVAKPFEHLLTAAVRGPARNRIGSQARLGRGVDVLRRRHLHTPRARLFDQAGPLGRAAVVARPLRVEVAENDAHPCVFTDPDRLTYRVEIADAPVAGAEVAIVCVVDTVERRGDPRQLDDLLGSREVSRNVEESGRETERPFVHGLPDQRAHLVQLDRRRRAVDLSDHPFPDLAVSHVGERVRPDAAIEPGEQLGDVGRTPTVHPNRHRGDALMEDKTGND